METLKSQFKRWRAGELTMLGSFQTKLFQAFQIADSVNQQKLSEAFSYWFLADESTKKIPENTRKGSNNSQFISAALKQMCQELIIEIKEYLDKNGHLEFEDNVNLSYADEEMRIAIKREDKYLLLTCDNNFGQEYFTYEIQDQGCISIDDLIWIVEQIENTAKGQ